MWCKFVTAMLGCALLTHLLVRLSQCVLVEAVPWAACKTFAVLLVLYGLQRFSKLSHLITHCFKPQLKILGRALSSLLYHCSSLKRLGRNAVLACKEAIQRKVMYMSSLQLTGKCLLCAHALARLGTCSVLRLLYYLVIS